MKTKSVMTSPWMHRKRKKLFYDTYRILYLKSFIPSLTPFSVTCLLLRLAEEACYWWKTTLMTNLSAYFFDMFQDLNFFSLKLPQWSIFKILNLNKRSTWFGHDNSETKNFSPKSELPNWVCGLSTGTAYTEMFTVKPKPMWLTHANLYLRRSFGPDS